MNTTEIQSRLDALIPLMLAKGMRKPSVDLEFRSQTGPQLWMRWMKSDATSDYDRHLERAAGTTIEDKFDAAVEWIAAQPSVQERNLSDFMALVGKAADMGRELGIEADFVNPLTVLMKTLSENAITHRAA